MGVVYADFWGKKRAEVGGVAGGEKVISGKFSASSFEKRVVQERGSNGGSGMVRVGKRGRDGGGEGFIAQKACDGKPYLCPGEAHEAHKSRSAARPRHNSARKRRKVLKTNIRPHAR
jgi:hypothetical protein